jgi:hypothetical protein
VLALRHDHGGRRLKSSRAITGSRVTVPMPMLWKRSGGSAVRSPNGDSGTAESPSSWIDARRQVPDARARSRPLDIMMLNM